MMIVNDNYTVKHGSQLIIMLATTSHAIKKIIASVTCHYKQGHPPRVVPS